MCPVPQVPRGSIGSSDEQTTGGVEPSQDSGVSPPELSRAVISAIAEADGALSIRDIENRVGESLGSIGSEPIEQEVHALERMGIVQRATETSRSYRLSEGGSDIAQGIRILSQT